MLFKKTNLQKNPKKTKKNLFLSILAKHRANRGQQATKMPNGYAEKSSLEAGFADIRRSSRE